MHCCLHGHLNGLTTIAIDDAKGKDPWIFAYFRLFGWLIAGWLAGSFTHEITVHVLPEQYFSLTIISRNSIFQSR